jgi:hypothetical protein
MGDAGGMQAAQGGAPYAGHDIVPFPGGVTLFSDVLQGLAKAVLESAGAPPDVAFLVPVDDGTGQLNPSGASTVMELMIANAVREALGLLDDRGIRQPPRVQEASNALTAAAFSGAVPQGLQPQLRQDCVRWALALLETAIQFMENDQAFFTYRAQHITAARNALGQMQMQQMQELRAQWQPTMDEQTTEAGVQVVQAQYKAAQAERGAIHAQEAQEASQRARALQAELETAVALRIWEQAAILHQYSSGGFAQQQMQQMQQAQWQQMQQMQQQQQQQQQQQGGAVSGSGAGIFYGDGSGAIGGGVMGGDDGSGAGAVPQLSSFPSLTQQSMTGTGGDLNASAVYSISGAGGSQGGVSLSQASGSDGMPPGGFGGGGLGGHLDDSTLAVGGGAAPGEPSAKQPRLAGTTVKR